MILHSLAATDFKNIAGASLEFSDGLNCFLGDNGMGKSNLLDALYMLSYCRSFTGVADPALIRRGQEFAMLNARYRRRGVDEELNVAIRPGRRKSFRRQGKEYKRLADHLGAFPLVLLSPADMTLCCGEPAERRRFIDQIASQSDPRYLEAMIRYTQATDGRNRLLRAESCDNSLYEAFEMQMDAAATYLCRVRAKTAAGLAGLFRPLYHAIAPGESPELAYEPAMGANAGTPGALAEELAAKRSRDIAIGHTANGPHRDDFAMTIDSAPVRRIASQGQTKTFTTALRLAQYGLLRQQLGINPLLLLDDIFDKLDAARVANIIACVADNGAFGQIFITDTNRRHLDEIVAEIGNSGADSRLWSVSNGNFTLL